MQPSRLWTTGTSVPKSLPSSDFFLPAPMKIFCMLASFGREKQSSMKNENDAFTIPGLIRLLVFWQEWQQCVVRQQHVLVILVKIKTREKKILIKQSFPEWIYTSCRISSFVLFCNVSYNTDMIGEWLLKQEFPLFSVSATGLF